MSAVLRWASLFVVTVRPQTDGMARAAEILSTYHFHLEPSLYYVRIIN